MLDEGDVMARSRRDAAFIRLNVVHWHWRRAVLLLEAVGGRRCQPTNGVVYRFLTGIARDEALDLVLRTFGSTVANPYESRPSLPVGRPVAATFHDGPAIVTG
jgi:hypothetical protein